jgi:RNA polymerase sigma factor (sigma-70 family)
MNPTLQLNFRRGTETLRYKNDLSPEERQRLVASCAKQVSWIVSQLVQKKYLPKKFQDEAMSQGLVYLTMAAERYNPEKSKFTTYASSYVALRLLRWKDWEVHKHGKEFDISAPIITKDDKWTNETMPMQDRFSRLAGGEKDTSIEQVDERDQLEYLMQDLTDRERYVVMEVNGNDRSYRDVGEEVGLSHEGVRQIVLKAETKMKLAARRERKEGRI